MKVSPQERISLFFFLRAPPLRTYLYPNEIFLRNTLLRSAEKYVLCYIFTYRMEREFQYSIKQHLQTPRETGNYGLLDRLIDATFLVEDLCYYAWYFNVYVHIWKQLKAHFIFFFKIENLNRHNFSNIATLRLELRLRGASQIVGRTDFALCACVRVVRYIPFALYIHMYMNSQSRPHCRSAMSPIRISARA